MYSPRKAAVLCIGLALLLSACARNDAKPKVQSYAPDGMLGMTQANPNLPTSPTYHTYASDVNLIHSTVRTIPGVQGSYVFLRGTSAIVTIDIPADATLEQAMKIKQQAQDLLTKTMPRYNVQVKVKKGKLLNGGR